MNEALQSKHKTKAQHMCLGLNFYLIHHVFDCVCDVCVRLYFRFNGYSCETKSLNVFAWVCGDTRFQSAAPSELLEPFNLSPPIHDKKMHVPNQKTQIMQITTYVSWAWPIVPNDLINSKQYALQIITRGEKTSIWVISFKLGGYWDH